MNDDVSHYMETPLFDLNRKIWDGGGFTHPFSRNEAMLLIESQLREISALPDAMHLGLTADYDAEAFGRGFDRRAAEVHEWADIILIAAKAIESLGLEPEIECRVRLISRHLNRTEEIARKYRPLMGHGFRPETGLADRIRHILDSSHDPERALDFIDTILAEVP